MMKNNFFRKLKKPYVIAEIGVNHECSIIKAKMMIKSAKKNGASAVKFQSYKADYLASKKSPSYWNNKKEKTKSQYELFKRYDKFGPKEFRILNKYCKKLKIDFLSTPFDQFSVNYLRKLVPFFKIASADINNFPLLKFIAQTKKPVLISTGASNLKEIKKTINLLKKNGTKNIAIMHCILNYPTDDKNANLGMITSLKKNFPNYTIGYSDHTLPDKNMTNLIYAFILGAEIFEKHYTFNKKKVGNDHYHAMDKTDLKEFIFQLAKVKKKIGSDIKKPIPEEYKSIKFARRSIYSLKFIKKGQKLTQKNIICKRPGLGINPMNWPKVIGSVATRDIKEDKLIKWNQIRKNKILTK